MAHRNIHPRDRIDAHLMDGTNDQATGNYESTAANFIWTPLPGRTAHIHRIIVYIEDAGAFDAAKYGNAIVLTNGIDLCVTEIDSGMRVHSLIGGHNVLTNGDWASHCFDCQVLSWGTGNEILVARFTFTKAGSPIILNDSLQLCMTLNDDFSGLVQHHFTIQGEYV